MSESVTVSKNGITLTAELTRLGKDISISVYGGDAPHIGAVVLAEPRGSLTGEGISVTSSVINRIGHKDEAVARLIAERLAVSRNAVVCCAAGVHIDGADESDIAAVMELTEGLAERLHTMTDVLL